MATARERDVIQDVKTDVAVLKTDVSYIKKSLDDNNKATTMILGMLNSDQFLTTKVFHDYTVAMDKRLKPTEIFIDQNKIGITWSNALVTRALAFLALAVIAAAFGFSVLKIISLSH